MTTQLITSYIDSTNLEECLDLFFQGTFDDVDQYLPRLYKDASELKPGNSLFGQIDSAELEAAIWGLSRLHRAILEYHFTASEKSWLIVRHEYFQDKQQGSIDSWIGETYLDALYLLSSEVMGLI
ncbi:hypothetical protein [Nostoc sp. 'Peltigera membranacea cyanobiont' N6]|uniref:hypothetical protein n=1 Tax=Nostoc sp. 'Peltigera membranacea cyanobiont' N6 TaxID=1261031 RepID=UPI000CF35815|nr:hypothetical protein [Nostoc sp. 'Peltigera membranacea cyanobiont' N6]AVH67044.1 hypothetical protein NPM_5613 [Nostoc sp. 'Peltigera membranacea cyanobiont' N6]